MPQGLSIHVGVEYVDRTKYERMPNLSAAPKDAEDMFEIARSQKFTPSLLCNEDATRPAFIAHLEHAANTLRSGDILLVTYSGHGSGTGSEGQFRGGIPGCDNPPDENDGRDETLCLYDGEFIDNEFYTMWCRFQPEVRIVLIIDSCGSGTVHGILPFGETFSSTSDNTVADDKGHVTTVLNPVTIPLRRGVPTSVTHCIPPMVLLITASQDNTSTKDAGRGERNSKFTQGLLRAWNARTRGDNYRKLYDRISDEAGKLHRLIYPSYSIIGKDPQARDAFEQQFPLSI